jgi:hypothetical protein
MEGVPKAGRLTADLDPPGFDSLAVLMGGKKVEAEKVLLFRPRPVPDPATMRARLHEAVQAAETALRETRRDAERAESALAKANARVAAVEKQKQERSERRSTAGLERSQEDRASGRRRRTLACESEGTAGNVSEAAGLHLVRGPHHPSFSM